jgi:hypothetical protein
LIVSRSVVGTFSMRRDMFASASDYQAGSNDNGKHLDHSWPPTHTKVLTSWHKKVHHGVNKALPRIPSLAENLINAFRLTDSQPHPLGHVAHPHCVAFSHVN